MPYSDPIKQKEYKKKYSKEYYLNNKDKIKKQRQKYYLEHKDEYRERDKKWRLENKDRKKEQSKKCYILNKEKILKQNKEYRLNNREKINERQKKWKLKNKNILNMKERLKRKNDIGYCLTKRLRRVLWGALNGRDKSKKTLELLGCTIEEFKKYIESKFTKRMSWDKMHLIHIDHIKPCAAFDLTNPEEQAKCFHYTNLQPLWAIDNLKKGAKYDNR